MKSHDSFDTRALKWGGWVMGAFLASAFALSAPARAQDPAPPPHGHRRQPPPPAFDACKDKKADDNCQVTFPARDGQDTAHTVDGTCHAFTDGRLFCRPAKRRGPPPPPPPPPSSEQGTPG
jgi:hypothetical protein